MSLAVRFSLHDVLTSMTAFGFMLAAFQLVPPRVFAWLSVVLVSSGAAWHLVENDCLCVALAAVVGTLTIYVTLLFVAVSSLGNLGSFSTELLLFSVPIGLVTGGIVGALSRAFRQTASAVLVMPLGMKGLRGLTKWIAMGYSVTVILLLILRLWPR